MERGEGRVYRKPGSRFWHMEFWVDGRAVRKTTGALTEDEARAVLEKTRKAVLAGDATGEEDRVTVQTLRDLIAANYAAKKNRSTATMLCSFHHLLAYFGPKTKARRLGARVDAYVAHRRDAGAAEGSIRIELALLGRAFRLAVQKRLLTPGAVPYIERPAEDESRVRQGFFTRDEVERLCTHLPPDHADLVTFLFWSAWRVNEVRRLEWRFYFPSEGVIRLPGSLSKNKKPRVLPVAGELAAVLARRLEARRQHPECARIFHEAGRPIGDFRKRWKRACTAIGLADRIVHDLRRSGVKHLIGAGVDPHTVMAFSGHRTPSMLRRYHIIDTDDLTRAAERAAAYRGRPSTVTPLAPSRTEPAQCASSEAEPAAVNGRG